MWERRHSRDKKKLPSGIKYYIKEHNERRLRYEGVLVMLECC